MGYQNSTFPLAVYGCMDTASRKLLWLKVWVSNHDPKLIGRWYLEHLYETKIISAMLRVDKGTETEKQCTLSFADTTMIWILTKQSYMALLPQIRYASALFIS